jgi:sterol desaturase/sphingolipid hydroxylase (fatty acid hydroxylase superfamily)
VDTFQRVLSDDLSVYALPIFALAVLLEAAWSRFSHRHLYRAKDTLVSIAMLVASAVVEIVPRVAAVALMIHLHEISPLRDVVVRQWWAWLILFVLDDFSYYWFHRFNHQIRVLWAGHVNHHSSEYLNLGTALRPGVGERIHKMLFWLWLPLLGFDVGMILTMIGVNLIYQFWVHTQAIDRLPGWFEWIFNTPSHHRVHHASNVRYLDCNHAGVLIIWDRLFATFSAETKTDPPLYGLTKNIHTFNPAKVLLHEYVSLWRDVKRSASLADKWNYLWQAPGWSHDGEDRRARTLRADIRIPGSTPTSPPARADKGQ